MSRENAYQLKRLPVAKKALLSFFLLLGAAAYIASWATTIEVAKWAISTSESMWMLGAVARRLAWDEPRVFAFVVGANGLASSVLVVTSIFVFRQVALRRSAKRGLILGTALMFAIGIVTWLTAPFFWWSEMTLLVTAVVLSIFCAVLIALPLKQMWFFTRFRPTEKKRVVVVGGGFAGLDVVRGLDAKVGWSDDVEIILVDRRNYFLFPPLLPSVAAGAIETRQVTYPFRRIFETTNVIFRKAEVLSVDPIKKRLTSRVEFDQGAEKGALAKSSTLSYDVLVLSPGAVSQTFNTPGVEEHALFMRELGDAIAVRNHVIDCFERAAAAASRDRQRELLRFVIVGAGPTGIELATEVHDLAHHVLLKRYPEIVAGDIDVLLVQSGGQVLPGWDDKVVDIATKQLKNLNIRLVLGTRVTEVGARFAKLKNGDKLGTRSVFWCAGVRAHPLLSACGIECAETGRAAIEDDLRAVGHDDIFVLGDASHLVDKKSGRPFPPLGQVAFQQGAHAAANVLRLISNKPLLPFKYFNFGSLVSVGEHFAAVHLLGVRLRGFLGWFVWRSLYLGKLVGTSNKVRVVLDWTLDLLVERSISQILEGDNAEARGDSSDDIVDAFDAKALHEDVKAATANLPDVTTTISYTETTVSSDHGLNADASLRAAIALKPGTNGVGLEFEGTLPTSCAFTATLSREDGLLGRDAIESRSTDAAIDDMGLGGHYIVDADERCQSLFLRVKAPLLALSENDAEIEFDESALRVRISAEAMAKSDYTLVYGRLMALWSTAAAAEQLPATITSPSAA